MFGECHRPSVWKRGECYDRRRQEVQANKQMLRGCLRCGRGKSPSQCSNYGSLKFTRLEHSVFSQRLSSTHSIPHNKLIRASASSFWFRVEELMQQHLVSRSHPSCHIQPAVLRLCIIFFKSVKCGHPCSVLSYTSLFPECYVRGRHINHTHSH